MDFIGYTAAFRKKKMEMQHVRIFMETAVNQYNNLTTLSALIVNPNITANHHHIPVIPYNPGNPGRFSLLPLCLMPYFYSALSPITGHIFPA